MSEPAKPKRRRWLRRIALISGVIVLAGAVFVAGWILPTATGFAAKSMCSAVFVAGREPDSVWEDELAYMKYVSLDVDPQAKRVSGTVLGVAGVDAVYRPGLGCALAIGVSPDELVAQGFEAPARPVTDAPWPVGEALDGRADPEGLDREALDAAVDAAFEEPDPQSLRRTRAVVVIWNGRLLAEQYAEGFDATTRQLGWSMSKSVTNALLGVMAEQGALDVHDPAGLDAWSGANDDRAAITFDHLLRMSSGLEFEERYGPLADATHMLFEVHDASGVAIDKPLATAPDEVFSYSSGTSNILCKRIRELVADDELYHQFPTTQFFQRVGMYSAVFETDPSGTFFGSSFVQATPRDWARFGLLYLQDGMWNGRRVLPEGWAAYSATATPTAERGEYAAHFWANAGKPDDPADRRFPSLPTDAYQASGFQGQAVLIVPSADAVIVRMGMTHDRAAWSLDAMAAPILQALPSAR